MDVLLPWLPTIGWSAAGVLVVAWLVVSFTRPGPRRVRVEWLGACALYVSLLCLFLNLLGHALEKESTVGTVAFGFLVAFFSIGFVLCLVQTLGSLRGPRRTATSAIN